MERLRLYYPTKPYSITQAWGISNPSYVQFGFSKHNGEDFRIGADCLVYAPIACEVTETGFEERGKGNFVRLITTEQHTVGDIPCFVGLVFMHGEKILVKAGDKLNVGDKIMIPDNTGFSTGPHTHMSCYRLGVNKISRLDTDPATNYTFDPHTYWTGHYAVDYPTILGLYGRIKLLLEEFLKSR